MDSNNNKFILIGKIDDIKNNLIFLLVENNIFKIYLKEDMFDSIFHYKDKINIIGVQGFIEYGVNNELILVASKLSFINSQNNN